jgi:hypothetical protein
VANSKEGEVAFIEGGVDRTAEVQECIDSTGYFVPRPITDPSEEAVEKQKLADVGNAWAQCLRDNGAPGVKDATVVVDGWETVPVVIVPGSIEVALLEELVTECPYYDEAYWSGSPPQDGHEGHAHEPEANFDIDPSDPKYDELMAVIQRNRAELVGEGG